MKGYTIPRTATGRSSLVPAPPWHYVGDFLVVDYWADPDAVRSILPEGLKPHEDVGRCAAVSPRHAAPPRIAAANPVQVPLNVGPLDAIAGEADDLQTRVRQSDPVRRTPCGHVPAPADHVGDIARTLGRNDGLVECPQAGAWPRGRCDLRQGSPNPSRLRQAEGRPLVALKNDGAAHNLGRIGEGRAHGVAEGA